MTIHLSCGHVAEDGCLGVPVDFHDEQCVAGEGFVPCTVEAVYCHKCAMDLAAAEERERTAALSAIDPVALVQAGIDAAADLCAYWAEKYAAASDTATTAKKKIEARDFESMGMACRFREIDIRSICASEIVKEMRK